jgi:hypothetical protein
MAGIPSRMNQSAREQILSSDLNRIGNLSGRELMDRAQARSVRADFYNPSTNAFNDFAAVSKVAQATPIAGLTIPPSLDGIAAQFNMNLGAGEAQLPVTPSDPDFSGYELLRWPAQAITWPLTGAPDATNLRICLIVATPADALTDITSRNILLDPNLRTVAPQNVYKTSNPVATISVVVGTAAASPAIPAVPAGSLALFAVYVPPAVADSTAFYPVRMTWRQIEFPGTSQHGIVKGCVPIMIDPTFNGIAGINRIVIDGEMLTFACSQTLQNENDTANTPGAAPAGNDMPTYLYLCGGRNYPTLRQTVHPGPGPAGNIVPCMLLESTIAPDALGFPTANLATAAGAIPRSACCYIGVRFRAAGALTNVPAIYDGDWIHAASRPPGVIPCRFGIGFTEAAITGASGTCVLHPPIMSTMCDLVVDIVDSAGAGQAVIYGTVAADIQTEFGFVRSPSAGTGGSFNARRPLLGWGGGTVSMAFNGAAATTTVRAYATGYNMSIPRLAR